MADSEKAKNAAEDVGGKIKEGAGKLTGDQSLEAEGKKDQVKSDLKQAGAKVKDAFRK
ncbi:CsbD family protein [Cryobacterium psychrophilum]|uniref:CsbD family protein n=1 Tax=Cryobacterium psychrophilum TaxID=41988 RepID=A0A4Y8KPT0_9MICO|nr:CsbD family protein [Cryobacterium psychrophilum]TDW29024.1 CsbD-like protein [Cryobacterium psychrophilum]TFD79759.1 CsbD family protein [Cryobacterium psychrophilum]